MLASEAITQFELQVNDVTELSTSEELIVLNRIYQRVCDDRPWEFLKTSATGTMSGSGVDGYYITVPSDFAYFYENYNWTDNSYSTQLNRTPKVIFVGTTKTPYSIINYSDRQQYLGSTGYAYVDWGNSKIYFTGTPVSTTYSMDYIKTPATLIADSTILIPERFCPILIYGMSTENEIIQLSDKAKSYAQENLDLYNEYLGKLALWDSRLQND
jgi:hypothetical protein